MEPEWIAADERIFSNIFPETFVKEINQFKEKIKEYERNRKKIERNFLHYYFRDNFASIHQGQTLPENLFEDRNNIFKANQFYDNKEKKENEFLAFLGTILREGKFCNALENVCSYNRFPSS